MPSSALKPSIAKSRGVEYVPPLLQDKPEIRPYGLIRFNTKATEHVDEFFATDLDRIGPEDEQGSLLEERHQPLCFMDAEDRDPMLDKP